MRPWFLMALAAFAASTGLASAAGSTPPPPPVQRAHSQSADPDAAAVAACDGTVPISRIVVESVAVFDTSQPEKNKPLFRLINRLHSPMQTRRRTVLSLLTIRAGDPCTMEDVAEAERELRAQPFLQDAWVEPVGQDEKGIVVRVRVQDSWSTRPGLSIKNEGGKSTTRLHLKEVNLLGTGSSLEWLHRSSQDRTESTLHYADPALHRTHWQTNLIYSDNSDGRQRLASFSRPFWRLDERWSFGLLGGDEIRIDKVYDRGREIDQWQVDETLAQVSYGRSPHGLQGDRLFRWGVETGIDRQRWTNARARPPTRPEWRPYDRDLWLVGGSLEWQRIDIRRVQYLETSRRVEDLDLSGSIGLGLAASPPGSGDSGGRVKAWWKRGFALGAERFGILETAHESTRLRGGWVNVVTSLHGRYYQKLTSLQTIVIDARLEMGENLEGPQRFLLGGETGLRGYRSRAFSGNRRFRLDLEHRFFSPRELLQMFRVGLVGFVEVGGAWDEEQAFGWDRIHPDIGIGLRLLPLPSSGQTTFHFNLALPLDPNGEPGGRQLRLSFSSGTTF